LYNVAARDLIIGSSIWTATYAIFPRPVIEIRPSNEEEGGNGPSMESKNNTSFCLTLINVTASTYFAISSISYFLGSTVKVDNSSSVHLKPVLAENPALTAKSFSSVVRYLNNISSGTRFSTVWESIKTFITR